MERGSTPTAEAEAIVAGPATPSMAVSRRKALLTGSAWAVIQNVSRMAMGLVSVPLTIGYLGNDRYGLWMTALSINSLVAFMDVGLTPTLMNRMATAHATGDRERFAYYASGGLTLGVLLLALGLLLAGGAAFLNWPAFLKVGDPTARAEATPLVTVMLGLSVAQLALGCIDSIFNARLQTAEPRIWGTVANLVSFALLLLGIQLQAPLPVLAALFASNGIVYRIPLVAQLLVREPNLFKLRFDHSAHLLRELIPVSIYFMGIQASFAAFQSLPNLLIARALSLSDVATFSVASRLMVIPQFLIAAVLPVFWPAFTAAWARGEKPWLRRHLTLLLLATAGGIIIFDVGAGVLGKPFIHWWTQGHTDVEGSVLYALGAWLLFQSIVYWISTFLHSISDFRFELVCYVAPVVLLVALAYWLLPLLGILGISMAMAASLLIGSLLPMWIRVRQKLRST